jgi:carboxylate-amine ligase
LAAPKWKFTADRAAVKAMVDSGTILDEGMVYFDVRLSPQHPTLEVRIADVCLLPDDAVLLAALVRALVDTSADEWRAGGPLTPLRVELLRLAAWRASRSGLDGDLLDSTGRPASSEEVVWELIRHVRPALQESGELDVVEDLVTTLLQRGNGANAQQEVYRRTGCIPDVVNYAVQRTVEL